MSDDLTTEEIALGAKIEVAGNKLASMKKGLAQEKNLISAKKKHLTAQTTKPPAELTQFLNSTETFEVVLKALEGDLQSILVRRYVTIAVWACTLQ